ncbi:outer membrane protein assembly factor BamB family protein [Natrarchaeobius oligotrophus]|nr:PQQ-binding-like beta-propeller repeat protein [Natrarchaeobius chitinivorans]
MREPVSRSAIRRATLLTLAVMVAVLVGSTAAAVADEGATVTITADDTDVEAGESITFEIQVENVDDVGAYSTDVEVSSTDLVEITAVEPTGDPLFETAEPVSTDGSSAGTDVVYGDEALESNGDALTVATVTVTVVADGEWTLEATVDAIGDEHGASYDVETPTAEEYVADRPDERWNVETSHSPYPPDVADGVAYVTTSGHNSGALYAVDESTGETLWSTQLSHEPHAAGTVSDGTIYVGLSDGNVTAVDAETGDERWAFDAEGQVRTRPAVSDGTVVVGTRGWSVPLSVYGIDAETGEKKWEFDDPSDFVHSDPTVSDGTVFVGSSDETLYAIDLETGTEEWAFSASDYVTGSPIVDGATVYVGAGTESYAVDVETGEEIWSADGVHVHDFDDGTVYARGNDEVVALDGDDGSVLWSVERDSPRISAHGGTAYVASRSESGDAIVEAFDGATGLTQWSLTHTDDRPSAAPEVVGGAIYYGLDFGNTLYALEERIAVFDHEPERPLAGEPIAFDAGDSNAPDGEIVDYRWDFTGDGEVDVSTDEPVITHAFDETGHATVRLEIEDAEGGTVEITRTVTVTDEVWTYGTGDGVYSSPTVVGGTAYVGSLDDRVYAIDVENGTERWSHETGGDVFSSPTVVDDTVYVGSNDDRVYAIDAEDGTERWSHETGDDVFSSPTVADGAVFVGSDDGQVYAIDAENGIERWSYGTGGPVRSSPTVVDDTVYVGSNDDRVYAIDAENGTERWSHETGGDVFSSPTVVDDTVYVGSNDFTVYALDAQDGTERWTYVTAYRVTSSPTVADGVVYASSYDYNFDRELWYALDADDGSQEWTGVIDGPAWGTESSATVADGIVYVGSYDGSVYGLDAADGTISWRVETGNWVYSSPTVVDGTVYVGSYDGTLYALAADGDGSSEDSRVRHGTLGHHDRGSGDDDSPGDGSSDGDQFTISSVDPEADRVEPGESITVDVEVVNVGSAAGTEDVGVTLAGVTDEKTVTIDGSESVTRSFTVAAPTDPGEYDLVVSASDAEYSAPITVHGDDTAEPPEITAIGADPALTNDELVVNVEVDPGDANVSEIELGVSADFTSFTRTKTVDDGVAHGGTFAATIAAESVVADGDYTVIATVADEAGNAVDETGETVTIDTTAPELRLAVANLTESEATLTIEADQPFDLTDLEIEADGDGIEDRTPEASAIPDGLEDEDDELLIDFDGGSVGDADTTVTIAATGTDDAGNAVEATLESTITGYVIDAGEAEVDPTDVAAAFDLVGDEAAIDDDTEREAVVSASTTPPAGTELDANRLADGYLDVRDIGLAADELDEATVRIPIADLDTTLLNSFDPDELEIVRSGDGDAEFEALETEFDGDTNELLATVDGFSQFAVAGTDDEPPEIERVTVDPGASLEADHGPVAVTFEYSPVISAIDVSETRIDVDVPDERTDVRLTSDEAVVEVSDLVDGESITVELTVVDEAGNEASATRTVSVEEEASGSPSTGGGSGGSTGSGSGGTPPSDDGSDADETDASTDDDATEEDGEPDAERGDGHADDGSETDGEPSQGDDDSTDDVSGFGAAVAVVSLLVAAVVALRRNE